MIVNIETVKQLEYSALDVFRRAKEFIERNDKESALVSYGRAVGYMQALRIVQWNYPIDGLVRYKLEIENKLGAL